MKEERKEFIKVVAAARRKRDSGQVIEISNRDYANCLTTITNDSLVCEVNKMDEIDKGGAYLRNFGSKGKLQDIDGSCDTLQAAMGTGGGNVPIVPIENDESFVSRHYESFIDKNGYIPEMFNPYNESEIKDIAPTQTTQCGGTGSSATVLISEDKFKTKNRRIIKLANDTNLTDKECLFMDVYNQNAIDNISGTLKSGMDHQQGNIIYNNLRIRKLTPKECWRLMGFDDSDFEKAEKVNSNTQLYKQAGNSIVVNVLEKVLGNLIPKDEHIKILELFGGIGACSKALERLGIDYEIADYVEIDKYAVASYNAMHNTNFEPQDITTWDKDIDCNLIMHGSPCITADSLILTKDGYKQIIDINVGDEVLTKSNTWHKVLKKFDNGISLTGYLNGMGFENIHCTPNHKFYVREMYRKGHKSIRTFKDPIFKEVKDITKNDYFGIPVMQEEISFYTNDLDFWYMLGMYMGDGWLSRTSNDIIIACNDSKLEKLKLKLDINKWRYTINDNGTCWRVRFANKEIHDFIQRYIGTGSEHKHIPYEILALPKEQLQEFYNGYLDTDGCIINGKHQFSSINREMLYSFGLIINKLYHRPICLYRIKTKRTTIIEGRVVNQKDWYQLRFNPVVNKQDHAFYEDGYIWYPFKNYELDKEQHVYNMEVEDDHSYIVQGCISKNCQDFSLAGLQAGGDEGSGTRSSLMYETIRIVEKLRPKYVIWENVKNVISKKHKHNFDNYVNRMAELGYKSYYQVLNAKDYGIPQNRERVFTISIRGDGDYKFPEKQELKLKLKDMLEDNVDEKYYLSDKMINYISARGTGNFKNPDSRINLDIARPLTTDPNKRAGTTNYLSDDLPNNYNLEEVNRLYGIFDDEDGKHQAGSVYDKDGLSPTLDTMQGGYRQPLVEEDTEVKVLSQSPVDELEKAMSVDGEITTTQPDVEVKTVFIKNQGTEITRETDVSNTLLARDYKGFGNQEMNAVIYIKNNTKQGYLEAEEGDGVNIGSRMKYQRGNVQKGMSQTITTIGGNERGVVVCDKENTKDETTVI